jgi:dienelactone hydrolase
MNFLSRIFAGLVLLALACGCQTTRQKHTASLPQVGPWKLDEVFHKPVHTFGSKTGLVQEVYYEGMPFQGQPTRVFAYLGRPEGKGPFPAMLLVHGGGGQAFANWAEMWAKRGYVALAMDTAGNGPGKVRLPDGGPDQSDVEKFQKFPTAKVQDMWTYHAVAAVIRGHSLLASLPEVDANRVGITGISWGGYLTCIVAGVDSRLKCAIPVYGSGFLWEDSAWLAQFEKLGPEQAKRWCDLFDPSVYLRNVKCPVLFVNRPTDFHYRLGVYRKSYNLVRGPRDLHMDIKLGHSHPAGWAPKEIALYADSILRGGQPLAKVTEMTVAGNTAVAGYQTQVPITKAELCYTTDTGTYEKRKWQAVPANLAKGVVSAPLPKERPLTFFLNVIDERGAITSSPHLEYPAGATVSSK